MFLPLLASSLAVVVFSQEQEHFLDVKQIVKGTIEAMQRLPDAALQQQNTSTQKPEDLMQLFRLPADIMTKLAVNAGYLNEPTTSTYGPWIVARSRDGSEEDSGEWEEVRRKRRRKRPEDDGLLSLKDLLRPLPPVQQTLPQQPAVLQPLQTAIPQSLVAQSDPIRPSQDPLYRREVTSDGQVRFVPVFPQPTTSSPSSSSFILATPPPPPRQSDQRFDAPTFPPQINPFQPNALPPRIVLPPSPSPLSPPVVQSAPGLQLPLSDPVAPPSPSPEVTPSRKPLLVQPVIRSDGETQKPLKVKAVIGENSEQRVESASMEDDIVVHSVESEPAVSPKKSVTKTALRVRTIEHSKSETKEVNSEEAEEEVTQKPRRKASHPAKKRAKIMEPEEDEPTTTTTVETPTAELPSTEFKKGMENLEEGGSRSRRRRVHASKTLRMGRKGNKALVENEERVSSELEQLSEESDVTTTMTTPKRKRKSKKMRTTTMTTTTEEPTTTTMETTTTTTEEPTTTTTEGKTKRKKNRKRGSKKSRKSKKIITTTTPASLEVSAQHCSNIRSFARQFGVLDVEEFAKRHCEFIENYYVELTCDRVEEYVEECQRLWSDERRRSRD